MLKGMNFGFLDDTIIIYLEDDSSHPYTNYWKVKIRVVRKPPAHICEFWVFRSERSKELFWETWFCSLLRRCLARKEKKT
jgi:hypothetical protein